MPWRLSQRSVSQGTGAQPDTSVTARWVGVGSGNVVNAAIVNAGPIPDPNPGNNTAEALLREHQFALIRGNISEIKALATIVQSGQSADSAQAGTTKGVDAQASDLQDDAQGRIALARSLSQRTGAVVVISGAQDVIAGADDPALLCSNGCAAMQDITGSGCMLSALLAAYSAAAWNAEGNRQHNLLYAAAAGVAAMGICGERAEQLTRQHAGGNASLRTHLIDSVYRLDTLDDAVKLSVVNE